MARRRVASGRVGVAAPGRPGGGGVRRGRAALKGKGSFPFMGAGTHWRGRREAARLGRRSGAAPAACWAGAGREGELGLGCGLGRAGKREGRGGGLREKEAQDGFFFFSFSISFPKSL